MNGKAGDNYVGLGDHPYKKRTTVNYDEWKTEDLQEELTLVCQLLREADDTPESKAGLFYIRLDILDVLKRRKVKI